MLQQNLSVELIVTLTSLDDVKVKEIQARWVSEQEDDDSPYSEVTQSPENL